MCRISGLAGRSDKALVQEMCRIQQHGGPDDEGIVAFDRATLGNRRLAIVDVAGGHQPIPNEDESCWVTFNGEIYNHQELRAELEKLGHRFRTRSDTEVLVHGYEAWGEALPERLNGIFALAVWDEPRQRLLLARDHLGVKPLHYARFDGELAFASEVKALLLHPRLERRLDERALWWFVNQWYVPGEDTLFAGVKRLLPAHALLWEQGAVRVWRYWAPVAEPVAADEAWYVRRVQEIFEDSVAREMQGEVPLGVLLSGGMDSSSIVAVMSKHWQEPVHTFTVGFGEPSDELADARRTAEHFGTVHHELIVRSDSLRFTPRCIWHMDEPRRNIEPTFLIAQAAKPHVKVLHSGLGGDELFIGYDRDLRLARTRHWPAKVPGPLRRFGAKLPMPTDKLEHVRDFVAGADDPARLYLSFAPTAPLSSRERGEMLGPRLGGQLPGVEEAYRPYLADLQHADFGDAALVVQLRTYMAEDTLGIVDRQLAANGIEGRVPFCNRALVEFAFRIPLRVRAAERKHVLRKALKRVLPPHVAQDVGKRVFGMRSATWFQGALRDTAARVLTPERVRARGLFRPEWVERVLSHPWDPKRERAYTHLWNMMALEIWHQLYFEQDDVRRPRVELEAFEG